MFFKVEIGTSFTRLGSLGSKTTGYLNSLLLGCLTVIVATPCTGPFMGAAIGWGLSQPFYVSSFIFLSLGLGVAFPTMFLSLIPSSLNLLPKPGAWMVRVGQVMAIPMLLTAIWLAWVVQRQSGFIGLRDLLIALILIIISLSIYKLSHLRSINKFLSFSAAFLGIVYVIFSYDAERISTPKELVIGESWETAKVNQYRSEGKNVLVNFTADWCLTCKVNEAVVFNSKFFKETVSNGNIIYLVADWTNYDPKITEELEKYKRGGVPLYLYWKKDSKNPRILPAILSKQIFTEYTR
ncbi:MAG: thioredoxin family protein [Pseudomonadota bacterium]|nr:thioredoxin family protein [Pseudomonadota bacterium]